jgi:hypothetical protein
MVHVADIGTVRNIYEILDHKPEVKRPLGRHRHRRILLKRMLNDDSRCELDSSTSE